MKILLCEDEVLLSESIKEILKINNFEVDCAFDGEEALEYFSKNSYDVIILDIMMPKLDGLGVLHCIRESGSNVYVLILSAKEQTEDKIEGLEKGADDYLAKPFDARELLARINTVFRRDKIENKVIKVGNISLDRFNCHVQTEIATINLSKVEFQLLEMLALKLNNFISKQRIFEKVWKNQSDNSIVDVYVSYLVKKLAMLDSNVYIVCEEDKCMLVFEEE
ncbi:MAG: response regulator transcription factor [Bacilli bacterium]